MAKIVILLFEKILYMYPNQKITTRISGWMPYYVFIGVERYALHTNLLRSFQEIHLDMIFSRNSPRYA